LYGLVRFEGDYRGGQAHAAPSGDVDGVIRIWLGGQRRLRRRGNFHPPRGKGRHGRVRYRGVRPHLIAVIVNLYVGNFKFDAERQEA